MLEEKRERKEYIYIYFAFLQNTLLVFRNLLFGLMLEIVVHLEYGTAGSGGKREISQNLRAVQGKIYSGTDSQSPSR